MIGVLEFIFSFIVFPLSIISALVSLYVIIFKETVKNTKLNYFIVFQLSCLLILGQLIYAGMIRIR